MLQYVLGVKDRVLKPLNYVTLTPMLHALCIPIHVRIYESFIFASQKIRPKGSSSCYGKIIVITVLSSLKLI